MKKIFLIIGILLIAAAVASSAMFFNQRQQELDRIRSLEAEIKVAFSERMSLVKKIKQIETLRQKHAKELSGLGDKVKSLKSDISEMEQLKGKLAKESSTREITLRDMNKRLRRLMSKESELKTQLDAVKSDYEKLSQDTEAAREEKLALEEEIKSRTKLPREKKGVELKRIVVKLPPPIETRVLDVNKEHNFVIIALGTKNNIKNGDMFGIYKGNELIAKAVAENVYEEMSSITVLNEWLDAPISPDDTVRLLNP
ncbi:MAG: hypothetical protein HQ558_00030 [Candidatus Omnitrophica bacterium]|nr:hypothetical protein [Candidatus Omnitrophota bacterium]